MATFRAELVGFDVSTIMANPTHKRSRFYYENVILLAEDTLHCVPRRYLEYHSQFFRDMFTLPQGTSSEGRTDDNPIVLSGCTNLEFESLLEVVVPDLYRGLADHIGDTLSASPAAKEHWISVLKLACMWDMPQIKERAVKNIGSLTLPPIEMVKLGRQFKVAAWFIEGCVALIIEGQGKMALLDLVDHLGWETAARIAWAGSTFVAKKREIVVTPRDLECATCRRGLQFDTRRFGATFGTPARDIVVCKGCNTEVSLVRVPETVTVRGGRDEQDFLAIKVKEVFAEELKGCEVCNETHSSREPFGFSIAIEGYTTAAHV